MKQFLSGVISSLFVALLMVLLSIHFSKPVFLFQTEEVGGDIFINIKNIGLFAADRVKLKFVLANSVQDVPVVKKRYWTQVSSIDNYFSQEPIPASYLLKFDDKGDLGDFSNGEELRLLLMPKKPDDLNTIKARDLDLVMSVKSIVIEVDDMDMMIQAIPLAIIILLLVSVSYLALGYQLANSKVNNNISS